MRLLWGCFFFFSRSVRGHYYYVLLTWPHIYLSMRMLSMFEVLCILEYHLSIRQVHICKTISNRMWTRATYMRHRNLSSVPRTHPNAFRFIFHFFIVVQCTQCTHTTHTHGVHDKNNANANHFISKINNLNGTASQSVAPLKQNKNCHAK